MQGTVTKISVIRPIERRHAVEPAARGDLHQGKVFVFFIVAHKHDFLRAHVVDENAQVHVYAGGYLAGKHLRRVPEFFRKDAEVQIGVRIVVNILDNIGDFTPPPVFFSQFLLKPYLFTIRARARFP